MKGSKEWYDIIYAFEKYAKTTSYIPCEFEKETDKNIPASYIYKNAKTNEHFRSYMAGYLRIKKDLMEDIHDLFTQGCYRNDIKKYDHCCISTYEYAQDLLIENGYIKKTECER